MRKPIEKQTAFMSLRFDSTARVCTEQGLGSHQGSFNCNVSSLFPSRLEGLLGFGYRRYRKPMEEPAFRQLCTKLLAEAPYVNVPPIP